MDSEPMSYEGSGTAISQLEAVDLLYKLMTESTKVMAVFHTADRRISASVDGVLRGFNGDTLCVIAEPDKISSMITFDPSLFMICKYGDSRTMRDAGRTPFGINFSSILTFAFADGSTLAIYEVDFQSVA